jgi:ribonuclease E
MAKTKMLIEECRGRTKVALLRDDILVDYTEDEVRHGHLRGNIYKGLIARIEPSLQAAFVDIGEQRHGFLQMRDIHSRCYPEKLKPEDRPPIQDILKRKQAILVQVTRDPVRSKGPDLTTHISLAGRHLVLMPEEEGAGGISRRIEDPKDRSRLREIVGRLSIPKGVSVIVRTAGSGSTKREMERDLARLVRLWRKIRDVYDRNPAPALLLREEDAVLRALRDYLTPDVQEVVLGSESVAERVRAYVRTVMPRTRTKFNVHRGTERLMIERGVERHVLNSLRPEVPLPSGGSLVIQVTEALVSVDVNSGKSTQADDSEETALSTNLEAARELARQLRLRDLGGLIVVDFIDMTHDKHKAELERELRAVLREDKARTRVGHISSFGMLELSRQRLRKSLYQLKTIPCAVCEGTGRITNPSAKAEHAIDLLDRTDVANGSAMIQLTVDADTAAGLMNDYRDALEEVERQKTLRVRLEISQKRDVAPSIRTFRPPQKTDHQQAMVGDQDRRLQVERRQAEQPPRRKRKVHVRRPAGKTVVEGKSESKTKSGGTDHAAKRTPPSSEHRSSRRRFHRKSPRRESAATSTVSSPQDGNEKKRIGGLLKRIFRKEE